MCFRCFECQSATFTYNANGQQATSLYYGISQQMSYDGDGLRGKRVENGNTTYYLRSSVLGGQVVCELNSGGTWTRGYVYLGGQMLAMQFSGIFWIHQEPYSKGQRITNSSGNVTATIELDPWGGETNRSVNSYFQPRKFTTYDRDSNAWDEAQARQYSGWWSRFAQPDPYDGSYSLANPQSFNRYAYVQNDPVNFVDPTGTEMCWEAWCGGGGGGGGWGSGYSGGNGWATSPNSHPGQSIISPAFNSDVRQIWQVTDPALYSYTSGERGSELVPSTSLLNLLTFMPQNTTYMDPKRVKDFNKAFKEAEERLDKDKCADLFGGKDAALATLRATEYRVLPLATGGPKVDPNTGGVSVIGAQTNSPTSVFINSKGPFFNNMMFVPGKSDLQTLDFGSGLRDAAFGALLLLHELGHQVGRFGADANDQKLNREHTQRVQKACF
jgi:RHS repeat-associated protein